MQKTKTKGAFFYKRTVYPIFKNKGNESANKGRYQKDGERSLNKSKLPQYNDPYCNNK